MSHITVKRDGGHAAAAPSESWEPFRRMRDILHWHPFREMAAPWGAEEERGDTFVPSFEVKETKDAYVFKADIPGVKEKDLDISLAGNRLSICGKREAEKEEKGETYFTYERSHGSFMRSFMLPQGVDAEHVSADMKAGVLTLTVPKKAEVQAKKISLKTQQPKSKA